MGVPRTAPSGLHLVAHQHHAGVPGKHLPTQTLFGMSRRCAVEGNTTFEFSVHRHPFSRASSLPKSNFFQREQLDGFFPSGDWVVNRSSDDAMQGVPHAEIPAAQFGTSCGDWSLSRFAIHLFGILLTIAGQTTLSFV
jgi:hypothetical protein